MPIPTLLHSGHKFRSDDSGNPHLARADLPANVIDHDGLSPVVLVGIAVARVDDHATFNLLRVVLFDVPNAVQISQTRTGQ